MQARCINPHDTKTVAGTTVHISVVRQHIDRHWRAILSSRGTIGLGNRCLVRPGDGHRDRRGRLQAQAILHGVGKRLCRRLAERQIEQRTTSRIRHRTPAHRNRHRALQAAAVDTDNGLRVWDIHGRRVNDNVKQIDDRRLWRDDARVRIRVVSEHVDGERRAVGRDSCAVVNRRWCVVHASHRDGHHTS